MGNFGKRILIVLTSVVLLVALTLVLNAYQQRDKSHSVTDKNSVVYSGSYDGVSYEVTKQDVWENILYSGATSTINEMIDKMLLSTLISSITDENLIEEKTNYLVYGTTDQDEINKTKADAEQDAKLWESFNNRMTVLGYSENGKNGTAIKDYVKLQIAYDQYATYRIENGLTVGAITPDVSAETLKEEYLEEQADTLALVIRFYSEDEATDYLKSLHIVSVSSVMRYYIGDSDYVLDKNDDSSYYVEGDFTNGIASISYPYLTQEVTMSNGDSATVQIPNQNISTDDDGNYIWNSEIDAWEYSSTTITNKKVEFDDCSSFSTSNTAVLSSDQILSLYINLYNSYYAQQRNGLATSATLANFMAKYDSVSALNAALAQFNLVVVDNNGTNEIRKYVGDLEYVVDTDENGVAMGEDGYPTYKTDENNDESIPNYDIDVDSEGKPVLDYDDNFMYKLDANGDPISKAVKMEDQTSFTLANTIAASNQQLYQAYTTLFKDDTTVISSDVKENITYNYETVNATRTDIATEIFTTLTIDSKASGSYLATPTSFTAINSSETPYYLIYKLSSSTQTDPTEAELAAYKEEKIQEYLDTTGFIEMALAELRKAAGITFYDEFFGYDYASIITYDSTDVVAGVSGDTIEEYYTVKAYKDKKLCALTAKSVDVMGTTVTLDKYTITSDNLYDYAMTYSSASYISSTCLNKVFVSMDMFTTLHGTNLNYLTSKNWKMEEYNATTEYYNYYFEYYKSLYAQYGYSYYDSIDEFLYGYGTRSFDDMVESLERSTMRNLFIYNELVGNIYEKNADDINSLTLTAYAKEIMNSEKFTDLYNDYYSINLNHLLIYTDYNEDGTPDDYNDFYAEFDETTTNHLHLKKANGDPLTEAEYQTVLDKLYEKLMDFINENDQTFATSGNTILSDFVTEYNESSIIDGDYKEFKLLGLEMEVESLGEVTSLTSSSYVKEFIAAIEKAVEKLTRVDNDLLGYTVVDGLTKTEYGLHYIVGTAGTTYEKPTFEVSDENNEYANGVTNTTENLTETQFALYVLEYVYTAVYGNTDNPEENAGFSYPNLPTELTTAFSTYYADYMTQILDESTTYHSNYLLLLKLSEENSEYKTAFGKLKDVYYSVLFGNLS